MCSAALTWHEDDSCLSQPPAGCCTEIVAISGSPSGDEAGSFLGAGMEGFCGIPGDLAGVELSAAAAALERMKAARCPLEAAACIEDATASMLAAAASTLR